jgi:hypothetical protein
MTAGIQQNDDNCPEARGGVGSRVAVKLALGALCTVAFCTAAVGAGPEELSARAYSADGATHGVVVFQVNWGRKWGCSGIENAQLEALSFTRLDARGSAADALKLKTPSRLLVQDRSVPYAFLLEPGRYALSGYDVKVAISQENIQHRQGTESQLVPDGKPTGGSFTVAAGEIVYIGHFALDCTKEPIPWRYYINGSRDFERYVAGFRHAFPFIRDAPVHYRLFDTTQFGESYTLVDDSANSDGAPKTHSP